MIREMLKSRAQGRSILRKIPYGVIALVMAVFFATSTFSTSVMAVDAAREGDNITYNGMSFEPAGQASANDPRKIPEGSAIYEFREEATPRGQETHFVAFKPGADTNNTREAEYFTAMFVPPNTYNNVTERQPIEVGSVDELSSEDGSPGTSACSEESLGSVGWIICPITNFLAKAMDFIFEVLMSFLQVAPLSTNTETPLYRAWSMMLNIANMAFIFGILAVVYSQITTIGMSSYSAKKMLPKIIVAAIVVNLSYYICAVLVDASNMVGYSLHQFFISLRESLVGPEGNNFDDLSWAAVAATVLGGTSMVGITIAANTIPGTIMLVLPILVGAILSALVALIILAARQAIITVLIVISPLAFVAYILPGTEKYFDKWKNAFGTLLMLFPVFSVLFGGAQLAGSVMIQNANGNLLTVVFGMAVQVAPLVITPLLIKFGGGLLGKIAGIVNNPKKGLMDRTRNWAQGHRDVARNRAAASGLRRHALVRAMDQRKRSFELDKQESGDMAENAFYSSAMGRRHARAKHELTDRRKQIDSTNELAYKRSDIGRELDFANRDTAEDIKHIDAEHERRFEEHRSSNADAVRRELIIRTVSDQTNLAKALSDKHYEEHKVGNAPQVLEAVANAEDERRALFARDTSQAIALAGMAKRNAEFQIQQALSDRINEDTSAVEAFGGQSAREFAAGIQGVQGQASALANATVMKREQFGKFSKEFDELRDAHNLGMGEIKDFVFNGKPLQFKDDSGKVVMEVDENNMYAMNSMVKHIASKGIVEEVDQLLTLTSKGGRLKDYRDTVADELGPHGARSIYEGGQMIDLIHQGAIASRVDLVEHVQTQIDKGKVSAQKLATIDGTAVQRFVEAVAHERRQGQNDAGFDITVLKDYEVNLGKFLRNAHTALTDPQLMGSVTENARPWLQELSNQYERMAKDGNGDVIMTPAEQRRIQQHFANFTGPTGGRSIPRKW